MRVRTVVLLVAIAFVAGAMTAYYALWRSGALVPGHPLTLRTSQLLSRWPARSRPTDTPIPSPTVTATPASRPSP